MRKSISDGQLDALRGLPQPAHSVRPARVAPPTRAEAAATIQALARARHVRTALTIRRRSCE